MIEEPVKEVSKPKKSVVRKAVPIGDRILAFLSSVRFGVVLLCILVFFSFLGMVIIQQNVNGFDAYYASRTPAERVVYGSLGLFDIYHSWYFNLILLVLSLNIVLASIDRFPTAWKYISKPKLWATRDFLHRQEVTETVTINADTPETAAKFVSSVLQRNGLKAQITEHDGKLNVFAERGKWNRIGAYFVHIALLTLFLGHFVALQTGFDAVVNMVPGESTSQIEMVDIKLDQKNQYAVQLPFTIDCVDIQQDLIDPNGSIDVFNTMDWHTRILIKDPVYGESTADVSLNKPYSYRGYRFFQAQTVPVGNAREMTLRLSPEAGGDPFDVKIQRNGTVKLDNGTVIKQKAFLPDFTFNQQGQPDTRSNDYVNPAVVLEVTPPGGVATRVFAFAADVGNMPVGAAKAGYKWKLAGYQKAPLAHVLSIKYDPFEGSFIAWYFGGMGLILSLCFVFFISHKRIWALIDSQKLEGGFGVTIGGNVNRSHLSFKDKFNKIIDELRNDSVNKRQEN
ncbi:MAG: cytochrome c biogenesis protein ResB [Pyrinomonadaceae bacterium]